jgi:hypothetical protein
LEQRSGYGPVRQDPEYGDKQPQVIRAIMEAWDWLQREGILIRDPSQSVPWFSISRKGEDLLSKLSTNERWEKLGVDVVKQDLANGGRLYAEGPPHVRDQALEWVRLKEREASLPAGKRPGTGGGLLLIAESRIDELRKLNSAEFDFRKLVRFCEELNVSYDNGCYLATAMLTLGLLDHVPPLFGKKKFGEIANNTASPSRDGQSFREAMQHLDGGSRKVSDGILHQQIRKRETLPTAQQVCCGQQLDVLLAEIIRISQSS